MAAGDNKNPPQQPQSNDDKKKEILRMLQGDANDAAWRLAGKQFLKLTRDPLVAFLSRQLGDTPGIRQQVAAFLETDLGEALLAAMLSMGLSALPEQTGDVPKRLARELRVHAMTDVGDVVADLLMGPLRQVAVMYLQNVPQAAVQAAPQAPALPAESPKVTAPVIEQNQNQVVPIGAGKQSSNP